METLLKIFVIGGSGFVGSNLIRGLRARGYSVHALARSERAIEAVRRVGATAVSGDLDDTETLKEGMAGCDTVFHCAGILEIWNQERLTEQVNIDGTRNVVAACLQSGVTCLVYLPQFNQPDRDSVCANCNKE